MKANKESTEEDTEYPEMDLFLNESESDVVFVVEGHKLPAHQPILRLKSKVFRAMFSGKYKESEDNEVVIEDATHEGFKCMLEFVYTERLAFNDDTDLELIGDVLRLGDKYELKRLIANVGSHLKSVANVENIWIISTMAFKYKFKDFIPFMAEFIDIKFSELLGEDQKKLNVVNEYSNNLLFETIVNKYHKVKNFFYEHGLDLDTIDLNDCEVRRQADYDHEYRDNFGFGASGRW